MGLQRVRKILGVLYSLDPDNLLDVGSGRGAFLWPLLNEFQSLNVTTIDSNKQRANDLQAVQMGGISRLSAYCMDVTDLSFEDNQFDGVTMLEVLEHIPDALRAVAQAVRVARRFVVLTVPSKADDNPEHIHLFSEASLTRLFSEVGVTQLNFEYIHNHLILVANTSLIE